MAVWTCDGALLDADRPAACMVCSVTMQAFGPVFASADDITLFIAFARARGIDDVRSVSAERLEALHDEWNAYRETHPETIDDEDDQPTTQEGL